jgi:hypothetical protein
VLGSNTAPQQLPRGSLGTVSLGTTTTLPQGITWEIKQGTTVIASSQYPHGWNAYAASSRTAMMVQVPVNAVPGSYTAIATGNFLHSNTWTAPFSVTSNQATFVTTATGTRYLVFADSARISFAPSAFPTPSNPQVVCAAQTGAPIHVVWNYSSAQAYGYYTVLFTDRIQ